VHSIAASGPKMAPEFPSRSFTSASLIGRLGSSAFRLSDVVGIAASEYKCDNDDK
jgi:hypothetical protein